MRVGFWPIFVMSVAAVATGFAALYFVYAENWGDYLVRCLRGQETIFGYQITGAWTVLLPAIFITLTMGVIVYVQRKWFGGTEGTGIPQAIAALKIGDRPAQRHKMLSLRIAIGKILLLTLALLSGITVGREGPSVHVGACFMHLSNKFAKLPPWLTHRGMILAGSAAGIAAAFNTPIAGVIFCFEEVGRCFDKKSAAAVIRTVALACLVGIVFLGDYLFYTGANVDAALPLTWPAEGGIGAYLYKMRPWIAVPICGVAGGVLGGYFGKGVVVVSKFTAPRLVKRPLRFGLFLGLMLAIGAVVSQGVSYGGGYDQAKAMLTAAHEVGVPTEVWYYPFAKAAASFISLVSAIPGGLFDPSLAVGAGLGQLTYPFFDDVLGLGIGLPEVMMLFMAAYFSGVVQSPITVFTIMFEMTGAYGMILPLMFSAGIAEMIARRICAPSIYEALAYQFLNAKGLRKYAVED